MKAPAATLALAPAGASARLADYAALIRPRVAVMVLVTVMLGGLLAADSLVPSAALWHTVFATGLVTAGASILNQWLERRTDLEMKRTEDRPLATGRINSFEGLVLGLACSVVGLTYMLAAVPSVLPACITAFTLVSYVAIYTPLKRVTTLNTLIGAVPGAMPPVIGWTAVRGELDIGALALFLIVFVWQVPHFLAIAWIYRHDYAAAGMRMLPVGDRKGDRTALQMLLYGLALVPVSLAPVQIGMAGHNYAVGAGLLAALFLWPIARFQRDRSVATARSVLRASLIYLPGALGMLLVSKYWL